MSDINDKFSIKSDIKRELKRNDLTVRDLALYMNMSPGTMGSRLNGWIPWTKEHQKKYDRFIKKNRIEK